MSGILSSPMQSLPQAPPGHSWEGLMGMALDLARGNVNEVPVAAIIIAAHGEIIAQGTNAPIARHDPSAHAEIMALRQAGQRLGNYRLSGCIMVVTLEPCLMCVGAVREARLAGLVYGAQDIRAGAVNSCIDGFDLPFAAHKVWHFGGVRERECAELLHNFFAIRR